MPFRATPETGRSSLCPQFCCKDMKKIRNSANPEENFYFLIFVLKYTLYIKIIRGQNTPLTHLYESYHGKNTGKSGKKYR